VPVYIVQYVRCHITAAHAAVVTRGIVAVMGSRCSGYHFSMAGRNGKKGTEKITRYKKVRNFI